MSDDRVDLKVYDVPVETKNKYISMAKLDYDNELWRVLEEGMKRLQDERQTKIPELEEKVEGLQKQIVFLKTKIEELEGENIDEDEENNMPKTFGNQKEDDELLERYDTNE